jgi:uncharacterized protein YndB with AHSA1/START domain
VSPFIKLLIGLAGVVVAAGLGVVGIGALLPADHQSRRTGRFRRPPRAVWDVISNVDAYSEWRSDIERIERLPNSGGQARWKEHSRNQAITFQMVESKPTSKMVTKITDKELPFGGKWTFTLEATSDGCTLTIVEDGEIRNPLFRFMSRFIFGYSGTIDAYFESLAKKLGGLAE